MKNIEIDDELYQYIASRTQFIGETASDILRRLLRLPATPQPFVLVQENVKTEPKTTAKKTVESKKSAETKKDEVKDQDISFLLKHLDNTLNSDDFINEKKAVRRFLAVLSALHFAAPQRFTYGTENIKGSERVYFAKDAETILSTGNGVKVKQIPDSPFWVITNNNTARKGIILSKLMNAMDIPQDYIERTQAFFI
ncbi:Negative modulator of initiation of replication [Phocoenobacter uteri]|uniref:Negative modulator of initiation of replication n=1 Tax=Phocoenobacter uteri TaxID=146806 RepID=A0A379C936_9PAST|nr:replication initiation negative regulator SeqA [Phocoenobacter uteri]MDG6882611.1 Negative modulator of initiation of replication [Phocoenobacter uteri]SUB58774.1 Negative modulator of initiation of replication [Phocoenobacter uteri]